MNSLLTAMHDLRYAGRMLRKNPGVTAVAVASLALGIGANTAMFTLIDHVLLKTLPVPEPGQLHLLSTTTWSGSRAGSFSVPLIERMRRALPPGAGLAAMGSAVNFQVRTGDGAAEAVTGQLVSGDYFQTLQVRAVAGRLLSPSDDSTPGAHPVVVISHGWWTRRFGQDPAWIGKKISVNGAPMTIVGVAEPGFFGATLGRSPDFWAPVMMQAEVRYSANSSSNNADPRKPWPPQEGISWLEVLVRASPESISQAKAALGLVVAQDLERRAAEVTSAIRRTEVLAARLQFDPGGRGFHTQRRNFETPLRVLMGMVALVLLIACANVANLLLARGAARERELAVRASIGAGRARLVRQLLIESLLLAAGGGFAGWLLALWGIDVLPRFLPGGLPLQMRPDPRVLGFTATVSVATGLLFGLAPALRGSRVDLSSVLKSGGRGTAGASLPFGKVLVAGQVALSVLLLVGTGLFARSLRNLARIEAGFDQDHLLSVRIDARSAGYAEAQLAGLQQRMLDRVQALPGVRSAAMALSGLSATSTRSSSLYAQGYVPAPGERNVVYENFVGADYFKTVGMTLIRGRDFQERDAPGAQKAAVINESLARQYFPGQDPIGRKLGYGPDALHFEVIGVVRDARAYGLRNPAQKILYLSAAQNIDYLESMEVRADDDPKTLAGAVRAAIVSVDANLPIREVSPLREQLARTFTQERVVAQFTGVFSAVALCLACLGLYGVMSYAVERRTGELGIRMALGAPQLRVLWMILREALGMTASGVIIGLPLAVFGMQAAGKLLYGLTPFDPLTLSGAGAVMALVAAVAGLLPARRAARVDPMEALRYE